MTSPAKTILKGKETIAIIPARGGSKRILRKNVVKILGKPLIGHTIAQAIQSKLVKRVIVSTDDPEITRVSHQYGAEVVRRPAALSDNKASSESAILHVLNHLKREENYEPDIIVFLQCTSPFRQTYDIDNAIRLFVRKKADSLLSVVRRDAFIWQVKNCVPHSLSYDISHRLRTQDFLPMYEENGSIFIFKTSLIRKIKNRLGGKIILYEMSYWSRFDIDNHQDLKLVKLLMKNQFYKKSSYGK